MDVCVTQPAATIPSSNTPPLKDRVIARRLLVASLLVLISALALGLGWPMYVEHKANWGVVVEGKLYRSSEIPRRIFDEKMRQNHITTIVYLSHEDDQNADMAHERQMAAQNGVPILNFPMEGDGTTQHPEFYVDAINAIVDANKAGKTVLVHCHSGAQRTGGVVAIYRTLVEGKTAQEAVAEMIHYRHDPARNPNLLPFLNTHVAQWAAELVHRGIIAKAPSPLPNFVTPG